MATVVEWEKQRRPAAFGFGVAYGVALVESKLVKVKTFASSFDRRGHFPVILSYFLSHR